MISLTRTSASGKYNQDIKYQLRIPDKKIWKKNCYTDGSKINNGANQKKKSERLSKLDSAKTRQCSRL